MVARALERCDIGYFLGGSLASSYQGEPRATNDIDFVVALGESDAKRFANALGPEFDVDISPDGKWIASASADTTVRLWALQRPPRPDDIRALLDRLTSLVAEEQPGS